MGDGLVHLREDGHPGLHVLEARRLAQDLLCHGHRPGIGPPLRRPLPALVEGGQSSGLDDGPVNRRDPFPEVIAGYVNAQHLFGAHPLGQCRVPGDEEPAVDRVAIEDPGERAGDHDLHPRADEGHRGHLPRASAAEVLPGDNYVVRSRAEGHASRALGGMEVLERIPAQALYVGGGTVARRNDLVGVHVVSHGKHLALYLLSHLLPRGLRSAALPSHPLQDASASGAFTMSAAVRCEVPPRPASYQRSKTRRALPASITVPVVILTVTRRPSCPASASISVSSTVAEASFRVVSSGSSRTMESTRSRPQ